MRNRGIPPWAIALFAIACVVVGVPFYCRFVLLGDASFAFAFPVAMRWKRLADHGPSIWQMTQVGASGDFLVCIAAVGLGRAAGRSWTSLWNCVLGAHLAWLALAAHAGLYCVALFAGSETAWLKAAVLLAPWCICLAAAGWLAGLWTMARPPSINEDRRPRRPAFLPAALFAATFSALAIFQYENLLVPHGDAGMYEEHLWNFWHGKGFASRLDDGRSFLGEHIEAIHLLLSPIYFLHPFLPTLNVCQAVGLASGAIAVQLLAARLGLRASVGRLLGLTYLLYFPLQFLALEETWKTFRPETLGVPLVLFALAALEARRYRTTSALLLVSFLAKEEFALVAAAVGVTLALRREYRWGVGLTIGSSAYLALALLVLIPYFRHGAPPHYTPYFKSWGSSPLSVAGNLATHPWLAATRLATSENALFALSMLGPLAFTPLASPIRCLAAAPIFGYLMLSDLPELKEPWFHFHAPLVPLLVWAMVGGVRNLTVGRPHWQSPLARFLVCLAATTAAWYGKSPLSCRFYDPLAGIPLRPAPTGADVPFLFEPRGAFFEDLYRPPPDGEAAEKRATNSAYLLRSARQRAFAMAFATIRLDERVAATDYIRARFTHHGAAHDYPTFRKQVQIDDVDVLILDKTEGWWGRDPRTNQDTALLDAMNAGSPVRSAVTIRGRPFEVVYHDRFFLVVRRRAV